MHLATEKMENIHAMHLMRDLPNAATKTGLTDVFAYL